MQYKALPWLRVCTFGLGAQSANIWRRDWNVRNAIIEVLVLRNSRTLSDPPCLVIVSLKAAIFAEVGRDYFGDAMFLTTCVGLRHRYR